ncbi:MAG: hypothetical protein M3067_03430, partial [Chloroflexota bacterium]|nr:hypothetical protein [Chloroflexota bacterium]
MAKKQSSKSKRSGPKVGARLDKAIARAEAEVAKRTAQLGAASAVLAGLRRRSGAVVRPLVDALPVGKKRPARG